VLGSCYQTSTQNEQRRLPYQASAVAWAKADVTKGLQLCWFWWCFLKLLQLKKEPLKKPVWKAIFLLFMPFLCRCTNKRQRIVQKVRTPEIAKINRIFECAIAATNYCGNKVQGSDHVVLIVAIWICVSVSTNLIISLSSGW
jgi:hypothetical protein